MTRYYIVMCRVYNDTDSISHMPLSGTKHTKRFAAFLEMEHAKDNPQYAGEVFYIKEVTDEHKADELRHM